MRSGIIQRLKANWPHMMDEKRLSFLERETRHVDEEVLDEGVTTVLRHSDYPPTVSALQAACGAAARRRGGVAPPNNRAALPGDFVDMGNGPEQTFTPFEAQAEIERMRELYPEAFRAPGRDTQHTPEERRESLEAAVTRMYVTALRKCAKMAPEPPDTELTQGEMF